MAFYLRLIAIQKPCGASQRVQHTQDLFCRGKGMRRPAAVTNGCTDSAIGCTASLCSSTGLQQALCCSAQARRPVCQTWIGASRSTCSCCLQQPPKLAHVPDSLSKGSSELTRPTCPCRNQPPQFADVPQSHSILHAWSPEKGPWLQVAPTPGLLDLCLGERGALDAICRWQLNTNHICLFEQGHRALVQVASAADLLSLCLTQIALLQQKAVAPSTHLDNSSINTRCAH